MAKKQLIMEKSLELFAKQGFEATSVQQITDYCGISKGAFYLSFKSKDELILGLIDHFMKQIISDIDRVVKNKGNEEILYDFYQVMFHSFIQQKDFAKLFIKEQTLSFNEELLLKIRYYDRLMDKSILLMIECQFGEQIKETKYDLIYCIKGFIHTYSSLLLFNNASLDVDKLSQSLVEKTKILAKHSTVPFLSKEYAHIFMEGIHEKVTKEQLIGLLEEQMKEVEESIEKESLMLLKQQLVEPTMSRAIVKGLIENIQKHPQCKWIAYLLRHHYGF